MQGVRVARSVAWDALKRARGDRDAALRDELMRLRLDEWLLRAMAEEYAAYRCVLGGGGRRRAAGARCAKAMWAAAGVSGAAHCSAGCQYPSPLWPPRAGPRHGGASGLPRSLIARRPVPLMTN
jgi:hypothetical protein